MYIVLGATGHVGSAVADQLLRAGEQVTVVVRDEHKAQPWASRGASVAAVDVKDTDALCAVFKTGRRAFLLNPPAPPATDTDQEEHLTLASIVRAVNGSNLEKVVLESTYGAQPGRGVGDLSVLFDFEQALNSRPTPAIVIRAAYYMSNWESVLDQVKGGFLPTMFPADLAIPMVAPSDIGSVAVRLLQENVADNAVHYVEGPSRYAPADVAAAFASVLGRAVEVRVTPRDQWEATYRSLGFSPTAAASYARMTAVTVDDGIELPDNPTRGKVSLKEYITALVSKQ